MNKSFLNMMIIIIGLQSMVIMPSDFTSSDAQDQEEMQGIQVDPEHDEGLVDQTGQQEEDRTTQIELNAPWFDFRMISNNRFVEALIGFSVVLLVLYKVCWAKNDANK